MGNQINVLISTASKLPCSQFSQTCKGSVSHHSEHKDGLKYQK